MNLAIGRVPSCPGASTSCRTHNPYEAPRPSGPLASRSGIHVIYAGPVVVPVNARAGDLVKLLQLLAADLADLLIRHLDLAVIA
jgi:hypothetical protein